MGKNSKAKRDAKAKNRAKDRRSQVGGASRPGAASRNDDELHEAIAEDGVRHVLHAVAEGSSEAAAFAGDVWNGPAGDARRWPKLLVQAVVDRWITDVRRTLSGGWWPHELPRLAERAAPKVGGALCLDILALLRAATDDPGAAWSWDRLRLPEPATSATVLAQRWASARAGGLDAPWLLAALKALSPILCAPAGSAPPPTKRSEAEEALLGKVRALLAQAESTTFEEEAAAFAAKAQQLMSRHSIDAALLARDADERPVLRRIPVDDPYFDAKTHLLCAVAGANRCSPIILPEQASVAVVGFANDLEMTEVLFTSLLAQAVGGMTRANAANTGGRTRSFRQSFLLGFSDRISDRLREADAQTVAAAASADTTSSLLPVLAARSDAVNDETKRLFPHTKSIRVSGSNPRGRYAGMAAADVVDLSVGAPLADGTRRATVDPAEITS